jgi:fructose-bisphosphate aldolase class II
LKAAKAEFDSVVFDRSALPFEQNVKETREAVEALKSFNPAILVEGEIGDIRTGSEIHDDRPGPAPALSTAAEARQFVEATGVDILAPAAGNTHGMVRKIASGEERKHLNIARICEIKAAAGVPLTLHGASGTADGDLISGIQARINIVHINTELRVAWRDGLKVSLGRHTDEVVPYKILAEVVAGVQKVVRSGYFYSIAARFSKPLDSGVAEGRSVSQELTKGNLVNKLLNNLAVSHARSGHNAR